MTLEEEKTTTELQENDYEALLAESVSKAELEALKAKYNAKTAEVARLYKMVLDGQSVTEEKQAESIDIDQLRADLFSRDAELTNMDYVKKALKLRSALLEKEGIDIFLPNGSSYVYDEADQKEADNVAAAFQSCLDVADGDPEVFTRELARIMVDIPNPNKAKNKYKR